MKRFLCTYFDLTGTKQVKIHLAETAGEVRRKLEKCGFKVIRITDKTVPLLDSDED